MRSVTNTSPSSPYFTAYMGNNQIPQYTPCVKIYLKTNAHPIALLDVLYVGQDNINNKRTSWQVIPEQTAIRIDYGMNPYFVYSFLGYVASYKIIRSGRDVGYGNLTTTRVQYTITGTSQVMQSTNNIAWKQNSPSSMAATIATRHGMRSVIHSYNAAIPYRLQNQSDFKFLNQLADEIGYRFYVDNTDMYFVNPQKLLDRPNIRNIPQFWSYNKPGLWDTVRKFEPIVGTITPDGGVVANRNTIGLNPNTKAIVQAANNPNLVNQFGQTFGTSTITQYYNTHPAESYYEATQKTTASALKNLYWNTAQATFHGDARVKPNTLVNLVGSALPQDELGLWLVNSVTHCLEKPGPGGNQLAYTYEMDLILERDQIYTTFTATTGEADPLTQTVPAKLVGGTWVSSNIGASLYAT